MEELKEYLAGIVSAFERQPAELERALAAVGPKELHAPLEPGGWSAHQVLAHTVAVDGQALLPRLLRILDEERPQLPDWDGDGWMQSAYDAQAQVEAMLAEFSQGRQSVAARLASVDGQTWNRTGVHPLRGERTLLWWLEYSVDHVRQHLEQIGQHDVG